MNGIPPALIRPGRIDLKLHMGYVDNYQAELIFWKFFCMDEKDKNLGDIQREKYPLLRSTVDELIQRMRKLAQQTKLGVELEISPAEFISYLLFHALKFNLSKSPESLEKCCQSLLEHIPDFVTSVSTDRLQAIEHAKKKKNQESQQSQHQQQQQKDTGNMASVTTTTNEETHTTSGLVKTVTTTTVTTKEIMPTPPTSPAAGKLTASSNEEVQELGESIN